MAATHTHTIARAARALDANKPGWVYKIKLSTLDLDSPTDCVLGQVFTFDRDQNGDYRHDGSRYSRYVYPYSAGLSWWGGTVGGTFPDWVIGATTERVTELWANEIRKRRGRSGTQTRPQR